MQVHDFNATVISAKQAEKTTMKLVTLLVAVKETRNALEVDALYPLDCWGNRANLALELKAGEKIHVSAELTSNASKLNPERYYLSLRAKSIVPLEAPAPTLSETIPF